MAFSRMSEILQYPCQISKLNMLNGQMALLLVLAVSRKVDCRPFFEVERSTLVVVSVTSQIKYSKGKSELTISTRLSFEIDFRPRVLRHLDRILEIISWKHVILLDVVE
jgi:hypothetical protein